MKLNVKQILYRNKMRQAETKRLRLKMFGFILGVFTLMAGLAFASNPTETNFNDLSKVAGGSGVTYALVMATAGNIPEASNAERQGKQIYYKIYLLHLPQWDESAGFPQLINGTRSTIPLVAGEKWHYIGTVDDSAELGISGEEGDVASTIGNSLKFIVGGVNNKIRGFLSESLKEKFFIVVKASYGDKMYIAGDKHKPMKLTNFDGGIKSDNTSFEVEFKNQSLFTWAEYVGALSVVDPVVVAADATEVALTADAEQYRLSSGTAAAANIIAFTGMTEAHHLRTIELVGLGGDFPPTIDDDDDFLLIGGATWTAGAGARISFQIYKTGAATWKFIEVPGSRM